jgi:6-pyruvoyltetrahydropterin/6-carboxytetrahydropterin synthase
VRAERTAYLGRRYGFCAAHRLYRAEWDDAHNYAVFGKCANPHGHGHNYVVEVVVGGPVDCVTGMVLDLAVLDAAVQEHVLVSFDHCNLNLHPALAGRVPTSEVVCLEIVARLERVLPAGVLRRVRLEETSNNTFEYQVGAGMPEAGRALEQARNGHD